MASSHANFARHYACRRWPNGIVLVLISGIVAASLDFAVGAIDASFISIPQGSNVNLTAIASLDWVHWGLYTESSVSRKFGVPELIGHPQPISMIGADVNVFQFADNFNGYSWSDGYPEATVTNSTTGIWAYASPVRGSGFELSVPATTNELILNVFVGAFAAQGTFEAALSDQSGFWTNAELDNSSGNGPGGVYTLRYSALSEAQSLRIRWTALHATRADANVTLQAATLSAPDSNHSPVVSISNPAANQNFPFGSPVMLNASASDADGYITKLEFFENTNVFIGETFAEPFVVDWYPPAPGLYLITARATDNLGQTRVSPPVEVFVFSTGGTLKGAVGPPETHVNLTLSGSLDWIHWGFQRSSDVDRKTGVVPLLSDFLVVGTNSLHRLTNYATAFSWTDGTPVPLAVSNKTGVSLEGLESGFEFQIPAGSDLRRLKLYVRVYGCAGLFQAFLSDASAPLYADQSLNYIYNTRDALYTLDFAAGEPGTSLTVRYLTRNLYDFLYGSISLSSAALAEVLPKLDGTIAGTEILLAFPTDLGRLYTLEYTDSLASVEWKTLQIFPGTGGQIQASDDMSLSNGQRFYRLRLDWDQTVSPQYGVEKDTPSPETKY